MSCVAPHTEGALLAVRAQPRARRNELRGEQRGRLKVAVTAVAEKGQANAAVGELLSSALGLRRSQLTLVAGPTSAEKQFLVQGVAPDELRARIAAALGAEPGP